MQVEVTHIQFWLCTLPKLKILAESLSAAACVFFPVDYFIVASLQRKPGKLFPSILDTTDVGRLHFRNHSV